MSDSQIRIALKRELGHALYDIPETTIIDELSVQHGAARIDVALVNGKLHGFELKSDQDTLIRLPEQALVYGTVFDLITLVVGERHLCRAIELVPEWWGIKVARFEGNDLCFRDLKWSRSNPSPDPVSVASLLRRDEALTLLEEVGGPCRMSRWSRENIYRRLAEEIDFEQLSSRVRQTLRARSVGLSVAKPQSYGG